jgi:membrane protein implicated in regulation of membrane protease activity
VAVVEAGTLAVAFVVLAVALSALEIVAPGLVLLPFGLGAGVAAVAGFLGAPVPVQLLVFLVASFAFYLGLRPLARRLDADSPTDGIGANRLIGITGVVLEPIAAGETGLVRVDREEWRAESGVGAELPAGTSIRVTEVRGTRVVVVPEATSPLGTGEVTP